VVAADRVHERDVADDAVVLHMAAEVEELIVEVDRGVGDQQQPARIRHLILDVVEAARQIGLTLQRQRLIPAHFQEFGANQPVKQDFQAGFGKNGIGEFIEPDRPRAVFVFDGQQCGFGMLRLEIGYDRSRIGDGEIAIAKRRHFAKRACRDEIGIGIAKANRHEFERDALFCSKGQNLANERRYRRTIKDHRATPVQFRSTT